MVKEAWGTKRVCPATGKRFYDLGRDPVVSPYTGEIVEIETGRTKMLAADSEDASNLKNKAADIEEETLIDEDDDGAAGIDLDDDILEEDDNDNVSLEELSDVASEEDES